MALTFRKAMSSERDEVERLLRAAFTPYVRALGRELSAAGYARLPAELERGDIYVALEADRVVGVVRTEPSDDGLWRIEEVARLSGARGMSLYTAEMMEHLVRLYRRHGFEIVRRGPPDHGLDAHTRVHMVKSF